MMPKASTESPHLLTAVERRVSSLLGSELNNQLKLGVDDQLGETRAVFLALSHKISSVSCSQHLKE